MIPSTNQPIRMTLVEQCNILEENNRALAAHLSTISNAIHGPQLEDASNDASLGCGESIENSIQRFSDLNEYTNTLLRELKDISEKL